MTSLCLLGLGVGADLLGTRGLDLGGEATVELHALLGAASGILLLVLLLDLGSLALHLTGAGERTVLLAHGNETK